jgi:hypothetical protein
MIREPGHCGFNCFGQKSVSSLGAACLSEAIGNPYEGLGRNAVLHES